MKKLVLLVLVMLCGVAGAEPDSVGSAAPAAPAAPAASRPAEGAPTPTPPANAAQLRQTCVDAMNADPAFAQSIMENVDKRLEQRTLEAHQDAEHHIQKNERHVIYAYAAMWIIAALFVVFLWRRQQALQAEIAGLRKDLEAAGKETTS